MCSLEIAQFDLRQPGNHRDQPASVPDGDVEMGGQGSWQRRDQPGADLLDTAGTIAIHPLRLIERFEWHTLHAVVGA